MHSTTRESVRQDVAYKEEDEHSYPKMKGPNQWKERQREHLYYLGPSFISDQDQWLRAANILSISLTTKVAI